MVFSFQRARSIGRGFLVPTRLGETDARGTDNETIILVRLPEAESWEAPEDVGMGGRVVAGCFERICSFFFF